MRFQAYLISPLFGLMASAAAVLPSEEQKSLPGKFAMNGKDLDMLEDKQPCNGNMTVVTCTEQIAKTWRIPPSLEGEPKRIRIPVMLLPGPRTGYIEPLVYVEASECSLSKASVKSLGSGFQCNSLSCAKQWSYSTTVTNTETFGMSSTLTVSLAVELGIPETAKVTTTITGSETQHWDDTHSVATANSSIYSITLGKGEMCEPVTVQYGVQCKTKFRIADGATQWPAQVRSTKDDKVTTVNLDCASAVSQGAFSNLPDNQMFYNFCETIKAEAKNATINLGLDGIPNEVWSWQGCTWPTL